MGIKRVSDQLSFLGRLKGSLGKKPKKTNTEEVASNVKSQTTKIQGVLALYKGGSNSSDSIYGDNVIPVDFKRKSTSSLKTLDKGVEFGIEMSNLVMECERLYFSGDIEGAFELVLKIENIASTKYNLSPDDLRKYGIFDLLTSIHFAFFKKYGIFDPLDEKSTLERIHGLSEVMGSKFNDDDRTYYYYLNLINSYVLGESHAVLSLLQGTYMWILNRNIGVLDFLTHSLEYIKYELLQEKSGSKRNYILVRLQNLALILEKLSIDYLNGRKKEKITNENGDYVDVVDGDTSHEKTFGEKISYINGLLDEITNPGIIKDSVNN